ncbi:MAG: hypothetical protein H7X93_13510 [Sphingomonadaceae bacterium]|nr:hypothetical protein [Sphingomonadaceae bacterium]
MRLLRLLVVLLSPALLTGCLLTAGQFTAEMTVGADGAFTYSYRGEIVLAASNLADGAPEFAPQPALEPDEPTCFKESTGQPRPCTQAEIAEQHGAGAAMEQAMSGVTEQQREIMRIFLGGVDPADAASMRAFAERLSGQNGWRSVVYRGDGVFDVDFAITSRLDRDFVFPVAPEIALILPMVNATPRGDGTVVIHAPAFVGGADEAAIGAEGRTTETPRANGSFTIRAEGEVVEANAPDRQGGVLRWTISDQEQPRPTATIRLAQQP